jgi:ATP-binding cassette subfamily F protein uup
MIAGQLQPDSGSIKRADGLKVVWFDQNREQLDQSKTLRESMCPSSDSVVYRGKSLHITTWAKKFLFKTEQLNMQISYLSGGEQARILIANLMLRSADILILDEPTNDLDIPSLEVLEDSLEDFPGAVILVTHDRMMLDTVSKKFLVLSGKGEAEFLANYEQCEQTIEGFSAEPQEKAPRQEKQKVKSTKSGSKLSNVETRELVALPGRIERTEEAVLALQADMGKPEIAANYAKLQELMHQQQKAQKDLDDLFTRWEELESRK